MRELSRAQARAIAVRAQRLDLPRPTDLLAGARSLAAIQVDHTSYVAPSAELVLWSRGGWPDTADQLADLLEIGALFEHAGFLRPAEDLALLQAEMDAWPGPDPPPWRASQGRWVAANRDAVEAMLAALRSEGPMAARDFEVDFATPWTSSGWNNDKSTLMMLERLAESGRVAVSHREGRERIWDLAERVRRPVAATPLEEARRIRAERRLTSLGLARAGGPERAVEPVGERVRVEGTRGFWQLDPAADLEDLEPRVAVLSPLDRLVFDRRRALELFDFDYALEMYKPVAKRRWGYFALPVLAGDQLVGKIDAQSDRGEGELVVHAVHRDRPWSDEVAEGVRAELESLATMLGLGLTETGAAD